MTIGQQELWNLILRHRARYIVCVTRNSGRTGSIFNLGGAGRSRPASARRRCVLQAGSPAIALFCRKQFIGQYSLHRRARRA